MFSLNTFAFVGLMTSTELTLIICQWCYQGRTVSSIPGSPFSWSLETSVCRILMKRRRRGHKKIILSSIPRKRFPTDLYFLNVFSLKEQWAHCFPATTECVCIFVVALKIQNFVWFALQDHHRITIVKTTNAINDHNLFRGEFVTYHAYFMHGNISSPSQK